MFAFGANFFIGARNKYIEHRESSSLDAAFYLVKWSDGLNLHIFVLMNGRSWGLGTTR